MGVTSGLWGPIGPPNPQSENSYIALKNVIRDLSLKTLNNMLSEKR